MSDMNYDYSLFRGEDGLFKKLSQESKSYAEYGMGDSTIWMSFNSSAQIRSVDSSEVWQERTESQILRPVDLVYVDLGQTLEWGYPEGYSRRHNFQEYTDVLWSDDEVDFVLVDGRFRVCCFLTSLSKSKPGTKILFDDYTDRPHYHIVEEFVERVETCGTQALFVTPSQLPTSEVGEVIEQFRMVFQ